MRDNTKAKDEFAQWLVPKGVDLHYRQGHAFQKPIKTFHDKFKKESCNTNRGSATTALRYLAALWGQVFCPNVLSR